MGLGYTIAPNPPKAVVPLDVDVTILSGTTSGWGEPMSYSVDFGDGGPPVPVASGATAAHTYTTPGLYTLTITAADTGGSSQAFQRQVVAGTTTAPNVTFAAGASVSWIGIAPDSASFTISARDDDWELGSGIIAFGDGSASAGGFIEGYPDGITRPTAVSLSYGYRAAIVDAAIIPVGSDGAVDLYNGGSSGADLTVDLIGSYYQYPSLP